MFISQEHKVKVLLLKFPSAVNCRGIVKSASVNCRGYLCLLYVCFSLLMCVNNNFLMLLWSVSLSLKNKRFCVRKI